jgi:hypothetical protein
MLKSPLLLLALAGCGGGYEAGSYSTGLLFGDQDFPGTRLTHGCLDIALHADYGLEVDPTLDVSFGNRCVKPLDLDLRRLEITGVFANEERRQLSILDPRREMRRGLLGGKAAGVERLELVGGAGAQRICVSVEAIVDTWSEGPPSETCLPLPERAS